MSQWINNLLTQRTKVARKGRTLLAVLFFICLFFVSTPVLAQGGAPADTSIQGGVQVLQQPLGASSTDIRVIIARVIRAALALLGIVLVALILYAGFLWMTAGGNEENIANAKKTITNAVIGLVIILSAYAIVSFILNQLLAATGPEGETTVVPPNAVNFQGSGALGGIIKDHYPDRDAVDVPRNTRIAITFRRPIKMDSLVNDTNGNGIFGDCINQNDTSKTSDPAYWENNCDALKNDASHQETIVVTRPDTKTAIRGANVIALYQNNKVFTIVIRPFDTLGDDTLKIPYQVHVGNQILIDDPVNGNLGIFTSQTLSDRKYEWKFTCSTELDNEPPHVSSVFPAAGTTETKDSVIQVEFSEAMDPSVLGGDFVDTNGVYGLNGDAVFLKSGASSKPVGTANLVSGFRIMEFTPSVECTDASGAAVTNACGGKKYCLPVCDRDHNAASCTQNPPTDTYDVLVRAAQTFSAMTFASVPFTGATDMAGNALDADNLVGQNGKRQYDAVDRNLPLFGDPILKNSQAQPDNFSWGFTLKDEIDATAPWLQQITPGLDRGNVAPTNPWTMLWSKRMQVGPMDTIQITEHKTPAERGDNIPLCKVPRITFNANNTTLTSMLHCPFLNGIQEYYYPVLTSDIEDVHFNCFYPGKGPGGATEVAAQRAQSRICDADGINCCQVDQATSAQAFCCNGIAVVAHGTITSCQQYLNNISPVK